MWRAVSFSLVFSSTWAPCSTNNFMISTLPKNNKNSKMLNQNRLFKNHSHRFELHIAKLDWKASLHFHSMCNSHWCNLQWALPLPTFDLKRKYEKWLGLWVNICIASRDTFILPHLETYEEKQVSYSTQWIDAIEFPFPSLNKNWMEYWK